MRYTLKDYQDDAVAEVLRNLADAHDDWHRRDRCVSFSLSATTGAGKTVMAAAVIEALFSGNDEHIFAPDPGAVVLWFTDDPSLNEQTRFRLMDAADGLPHSRLVVIEYPFNLEKLQPGTVYFLNRQKLSTNSLLVRSGSDDLDPEFVRTIAPDLREVTLWDTIRNTIEDPELTLYLVLDEAHRGMKTPSKREINERSTIVSRLVNGANGVPPVPIVWGISATVERFDQAMAEAQGRTNYPSVVVDPARVQESGLLKDDIRLDFPAESGQFDTVLLKRATRKVRHADDLWQAYAEHQGATTEVVVPLLVVQVPNKPSDELLLSAFQTISDAWPELPSDAMAHVFGDHATIDLGGHVVPHISPEKVQDRKTIRVLFAKDAISTGWDCPRAEVLVSFRPAKDETHITQLLGRMVRTPLARRVPGNDVLNSVECVLPHFDRVTATHVATTLLGGTREGDDGSGGSGGGEGRRVLVNPVDMEANPAIPEAVWAAFDAMPSETLPRKSARPTKRLLALAHALARDGLMPDGRKSAYNELLAVLDGLAVRYEDRLEAAVDGVLEVEGETIVASILASEVGPGGGFTELADERAVEAEFRAAGRVFGLDIARRYAEHIAVADDIDDGLFDAHIQVAALARLPEGKAVLEREADALAEEWLTEHRVAIKGLSDERRAVYDDIIGMSPAPQRIDVLRPRVRAEETEDRDGNKVDTRTGHLMADANGNFPVGSLNDWELAVVDAEMNQPSFRAWYRNPSRPSEDSLAIAYKNGLDNWRRVCPDFVFFSGDDEDIKVSIVDPHGVHLGDALPKLRGLARFAESVGESFHRIESVTKVEDNVLRVLDLTEPEVRQAVADVNDARALYVSTIARDYR